MRQRTLPVSVRPLRGESFHSLMVRLAARNEAPLHTLMAATGFIGRAHFKTLPRAYGVTAEPTRLADFATASRIPSAEVERTLLVALDGICLDLSDVRAKGGAALRTAAMREWMYAAGSHLCPACLAEDGFWRLRWKVPWSFACSRHKTLLVSHCEGCGRRTQSGRQDGSTIPVLPSVVPDIRICHNPLPSGVGVSGRKEVCGIDLTGMRQDSLAGFPSLLDAQRVIDAALEFPSSPDLLGFFARLRTLCAVLLASSDRVQLGPLPERSERAWEAHERQREDVQEQRAAARLKNLDGRTAPRQRVWTGAPIDAALLAAVIPTAMEMNRDPARLAEAARTARATRPRHAALFPTWFHMPQDMAKAWECVIDATAPSLSSRLTRIAVETPKETRYIPCVWPEFLYERDVADLFAGVALDAITVRSYISLLTARHVLKCTWHEAGQALAYTPPVRGRGVDAVANNVAYKLRLAGRTEDFARRVPQIVGGLSELDQVDYRAREERFRHWSGFTPAEWFDLARQAGIGPGRGRDRYASAWLWADLTGQDWRTAPAFGGRASESEREVFRRFVRDLLPTVRAQLIAVGRSMSEPQNT